MTPDFMNSENSESAPDISPGSFEFTKWYLDGVAPSGDLFMGYWVRLRWRGLAVTWHSTITTE